MSTPCTGTIPEMDAARRAAIDAQRALLEVAFQHLRDTGAIVDNTERIDSRIDSYTPEYIAGLEDAYVAGKLTGAAVLAYDGWLRPQWHAYMRGDLDVLPDPFFDEPFQSEVARAEKDLLRQDGPRLRGNGGPAFSDVGDVFRVPGGQDGVASRSVLINTSKAARGCAVQEQRTASLGGADAGPPANKTHPLGAKKPVCTAFCSYSLFPT